MPHVPHNATKWTPGYVTRCMVCSVSPTWCYRRHSYYQYQTQLYRGHSYYQYQTLSVPYPIPVVETYIVVKSNTVRCDIVVKSNRTRCDIVVKSNRTRCATRIDSSYFLARNIRDWSYWGSTRILSNSLPTPSNLTSSPSNPASMDNYI